MSFRGGDPQRSLSAANRESSGGVNGCGVNQHDWDLVLNGVNAAALAAFQALRVRGSNYRLTAHWADERGQQIFGNHSEIIVMRPACCCGWRSSQADPLPRRHRGTQGSGML